MGYPADHRKSSRNPQTSRVVKEKTSLSRAAQSPRLHDQLKLERPISQSYDDLHHEVKQGLGDGPFFPRKSLGNQQKPSVERKAKDDELVKHMSNLPRYLQRVERGENLQEKVLNFGVLDWGRLENWKFNHKPVPYRCIMYSPSTSNTSSPFSTVGSSTLSTRSDSGILAQRKQSPSRSAHLTSSSKEYHSPGVKPNRENAAALQDFKTVAKSASVGQRKLPVTDSWDYSRIKFEKGKKNDSNSKIKTGMGISSPNSKTYEVSFPPKGKTKATEGESTQKTKWFQESTIPGHCPGRDKTIVLLLPKKKISDPSQNAESTMLNDSRESEATRRSFSDGFSINEDVQFSHLHSDTSHSCPQLSRTGTSTQPNVQGLKVPSDVSRSLPHSGERLTIRSEVMQAEEKKLTTKRTNLEVMDHLKGSVSKAVDPPSARRGNQSPNRWSSVGLGMISRSLSFKEGSASPPLNSSYLTAKSGPVESDACSDSLIRDKAKANNRSRSSPLRRLLDPLLKPKAANRLTSMEPIQGESHKVCKSPLDSSIQPVKRSTTFSGSRLTDTNGVHQDEKHVVPMVQALLQVTVKNGLPWFTFAVDSNDDILAATMRKINASGKYDCNWIYTFYSFRKTKKKSGGWMSHGGKAKSRDYFPNIVGQMKVNGSQCPKSTKHDSEDQVMVREFVLFDVEPRKADQEAVDPRSNGELAAIVIKVPKEITECQISTRQQSNNHKDLSEMRFPECSPENRRSCNSLENSKSKPMVGHQCLCSTVVILPSGIHGVSATGLPSPLIDRWRSGGSCDCGGWDVGCQLRVLSNQDQCHRKLDATKVCGTEEQFNLFVQGGTQENIPSVSLATYNKGVHSVDFNASISSLQAFSICIAFLHCKNLAKVSNLFLKQEPLLMERERIKVSTQIEGMAPSSCATFPPPSPVGRV